MDKTAINNFAVEARKILMNTAIAEAGLYGITKSEIKLPIQKGDGFEVYETIAGTENRIFSDEIRKRDSLVKAIKEQGFEQVIEETAYTWFNRLIAIRFMEVNNYLPTRVRVLSSETGSNTPDIINLSETVDLNLSDVEKEKIRIAKSENRYDDVFRSLFIKQCNELNGILPGLFDETDDYMELLLKLSYTNDGVVRMLIDTVPENDFNVETEGQIEIIGWMYQYYISAKHEEVIDPLHGKTINKEDVPAATQLFTTDWVVRYLIENSIGRYWMERNPGSDLSSSLNYYVKSISDAGNIVDEKIRPQDVKVFDPCVGSGHFLVYAFDVLMMIYKECGYSERDAAEEIVKYNLFGLDIDKRAKQLAYFAIMMKARQYNKLFFKKGIQPNIFEILESNNANLTCIQYFYGDDIALKNDIDILLESLEDAKEYGSILRIPNVDFDRINQRFEQLDKEMNLYNPYLLGEFKDMIRVAELISRRYAIVDTNPPYLNKYSPKLKAYVTEHFLDYSGDLFSVFMKRNIEYCMKGGYAGFMTPYVWMFIQTYEDMRKYIVNNIEITSLIQFEYSAYEEATVPICSFVLKKEKSNRKSLCFRLTDFKGGMEIQRQKVVEAISNPSCGYYYETDQSIFLGIPGTTIAYWASSTVIEAFNNVHLSEDCETKKGLATSDNNRFLRLWFEVDNGKISFDCISNDESATCNKKWFPHNKGGDFRRWYGNKSYVINWENDGYEIRNFRDENGKLLSRPQNLKYNFKQAVTWSKITSGTFSARICFGHSLFDDAAAICYHEKLDHLYYVLGFLNSKCCQAIIEMLNPTINLQIGDIGNLPIIIKDEDEITKLVESVVSLSKDDWDSFETSWDFETHPLVRHARLLSKPAYCEKEERNKYSCPVEHCFVLWQNECDERFRKVVEYETLINRHFIEMYGLQNELSPEVDDKVVTIRKADLRRDIQSLISYAVGCMFGRYSLSEDGLLYAGGSFDQSKYGRFTVDKDAIIPITDEQYFDDDIISRFEEFIGIVFGSDYVEENLEYIAKALGTKGISSREKIRNYFLDSFYKNHCNIYSVTGSGKRPIYWMFNSGKQNGFKALIYLHRYTPDTVGLIRTDYLTKTQTMIEKALANAEYVIKESGSAVDRALASKKKDKYMKQLAEIRAYYPALSHIAMQRIDLNLDDGVKANYMKFQKIEVSLEGEKKRTVSLLADI